MKHCHCFENLGLLKSFRRLWVWCKSSFCWDWQLNYEHLVTGWYRSHTILSYQYTISWYYLKHFFYPSTIHHCVLHFPKQKFGTKDPNGDAHGVLLPRFPNRIFGKRSNRTEDKNPASVCPNRTQALFKNAIHRTVVNVSPLVSLFLFWISVGISIRFLINLIPSKTDSTATSMS
jgi:hypothetical protein